MTRRTFVLWEAQRDIKEATEVRARATADLMLRGFVRGKKEKTAARLARR
jgi:hypothetical protein